MIGVLAFVVVAQGPPVMSAEEIQRRLEAPVTYQSEPARLPVVLDQIGGLVGVRVRCEQALQPAVVVVNVRNRPAKEVIKQLVDGIGAGYVIQGGTFHVSMRVLTEQQAEKRKESEIRAIRASLEQRAKNLKIDEPLDPQVPQKYAAQAMFILQGSPNDPRMPNNSLYSATGQAPSARAAAGILRALGPEILRPEENKPKVVDMRSLDDKQASEVAKILGKFETEQQVWSKEFEPVFRMMQNANWAPINEDLLERSMPLNGAKPDAFRLRITPNDWGTGVQMEIMAGGMTLFEAQEYLPRQRIYTDPGGEPFSAFKANQIKVPLPDKLKRIEAYRRGLNNGQLKFPDEQLMKQIADPWKNELISYTRAQMMPVVADKLEMNLMVYLSDALMNQVMYDYYGQTGTDAAQGDQVLNMANYSGVGLRKKGDWLIGYATNPEQYLANQLDRAALGRFLTLALRPGALTFDQMLKARQDLGYAPLQTARSLARLVRPGFDSLNPVSVEILDIFNKLKPGQLALARGSGLPVAGLGEDMEALVRRFVGYRSRRNRSGIPEDSIDSPPTLEDFRKAKLTFTQSSDQGILTLENNNGQPRTMNMYAYYNFQRFEDYRGYNSLDQVAQALRSRYCWPARMDTLRLNVDIPRKRSQMIATAQYVTDVSVDPTPNNQVAQMVGRYFRGN